jgi:hypothetical protein
VVFGGEAGEQVCDGLGGVVGEDGADGDLVVFLVVDGLDVEGLQQAGQQLGGDLLDQAGQQRQGVQQAGVLGGLGGGGQGVELGGGLGAFVLELGEAGADAGAVGADRRAGAAGVGL